MALAREGAEEGTRVVALRQRSGRGRHGHSWESPEGGLYLSIVLATPSGRTTLFPIALSAALASELAPSTPVPLKVRWPNDLLAVPASAPAQKLGGVLADEVPSPRLGRAVVAGIGINVTTSRAELPPDVGPRAAVLSELTGTPRTLDEVEAQVVRAALRTATTLRSGEGTEEMLALARRYFWDVGRPARIDGRPVGRIVGLGDDGELRVEDHGVPGSFWTGVLEVDDSPSPGVHGQGPRSNGG